MKKQDKVALTQELSERLTRATMVLVSEFRGLSVVEANELRKRIRQAQGELKVAKNTLIARAIEGSQYAPVRDQLGGPVALIFCFGDPATLAKVVTSSSKEIAERFKLRGGVMGGRPLSAQEIEELANLPPKEVLMARLLGLLKAPAARLLGVLSEPGNALARVIDAIGKRQSASA